MTESNTREQLFIVVLKEEDTLASHSLRKTGYYFLPSVSLNQCKVQSLANYTKTRNISTNYSASDVSFSTSFFKNTREEKPVIASQMKN